MKVHYDPETDTLTIRLRDERIKESEEVRPGVIADYGHDGGIVRFEVLRASKVVQKTTEMQFAVGK
jgi:uncharacterized protein YuzE